MLSIRSLTKTFRAKKGDQSEEVVAVDGISLEVAEGDFFTLLGPSGCGKTTTLRCIAGLEHADAGEISVAGRTLYSSEKGIQLRANQRHLGMVFQSYAIWPHMDVFSNVAFPMQVVHRKQRLRKKEMAKRVDQVLTTVQLDHLVNRPATDLSGGQQQRLALARALVMNPPLLLLDEPLSNLDAKLREDMRLELKSLQRNLGITLVYVTHDQVEALAMSTKIAVMQDGRVAQVGRPREVYERPASRFVAGFIGSCNFLEGTISAVDANHLYRVDTDIGALHATSDVSYQVGSRVVVSVRPEHVKIEKDESVADRIGLFNGVVETRAFLGESVDHVVRVGSLSIRARCNASTSIRPGTDVTLTVPPELCALVPE